MNCDAKLLEGMKRAAAITAAAEKEVTVVNEFFQLVRDAISTAAQNEGSFFFRIDEGALCVIDARTTSDSNQPRISQLAYQPGAMQFLYSDFRGGPSYPIPPSLASIPVLVTYIGISLHFFRWGAPSPYFQDQSKSILSDRDFLSSLGP